MILCKVALDVANNNSAVATVLYDVSDDGKTRKRIPGTARLWTDTGATQRNSVLIPSVILYERENSGKIARDCYGYDALDIIRDSDTKLQARENIKYRFFVEDDPYTYAEDFTNLTRYLLDCIQYDDDTQPDTYEIWLSHPVICDEDNLFHLENIINDALSKHSIRCQSICFINEADCAFRFAISDKKVQAAIKNTFKEKNKAIALVCDIGGSTMELSLYRFTRNGQKIQHKTEAILRATDAAGRGLGSHAMDTALRNKLTGTNGVDILDKEKLNQIDSSLLMLRWITPLKEDLNNRLRKGKAGSLNSLHAIAVPEKLIQNDTVTRSQFEQWCLGYTSAVRKQIEKLAEQAGIKPTEIDLAILTGGGCELYPIEMMIRELLKPGSGSTACVLRPDDPSSILDKKIVMGNNPDYYNGLCPKAETASLACTLGNLAEEVTLMIPKTETQDPATPKKGGNQIKPDPGMNLYVATITNLERRKDEANKWVYGYTVANFGLAAVIPPGVDIQWLMGIESVMAVHIATIMYKGTGVETKDIMTAIVTACGGPLLASMAGTLAFNEGSKALGLLLAPASGGISVGISALVGGGVAAAMTLALGRTYIYITDQLITGKLTKEKLISKDPETIRQLKKITRESYRKAKKEVKKDDRFKRNS